MSKLKTLIYKSLGTYSIKSENPSKKLTMLGGYFLSI